MPEELSNEPSWGTAPRKLGQDALIWRVEVREALREREKTETTRKQRHEPRESENRSERDRTKRARGVRKWSDGEPERDLWMGDKHQMSSS